MLTCWSDSARVMSDSSRLRSSASTWIATRKELFAVGAQLDLDQPLGLARRFAALTQSVRCTETPEPWVTKPMISSPGTGVQHLASLTSRSLAPTTSMPDSARPPVPARAAGR